jgi:hypothetical protein
MGIQSNGVGLLESFLDRHRRNAAWMIFIAVAANLLFVIVFWLWRVYLLNDQVKNGTKHFKYVNGAIPSLWGDSFMMSVMNQSTIGSASIIPQSSHASTVTTVQGLAVIIVYFSAIVLLLF